MPTFQGIVSEEGVQQLIEYVKSLGTPPGPATPAGPGTKSAATVKTTSPQQAAH
jgi:hypothetical protein